MKVRITGCSGPTSYWYRKRIGEIFDIEIKKSGYKVTESTYWSSNIKFIKPEDCISLVSEFRNRIINEIIDQN